MADVVPVRARFRTVKSQCTGHNRRPCTCSVTKNVDILSALALSHQACQSELGFSRVAPRCGRLTAMGKKVGQKEFAEGLRKYPQTTPKTAETVPVPQKEGDSHLKSRLS